VKDLYRLFRKQYDPLLKFVNELSEMPEFEELKKKMYDAKEKEFQEKSCST
jgi:mRNA-degrading endonuclease RelE of RelBE toxin-antitoxin system